jgi:two-component system chemotaxis response regulator CheB
VLLAGHDANTSQTLAWVRQIMQTKPLPIVVASPPGGRADERQAFELLSAGAVSVVHEPDHRDEGGDEAGLVQTVRLMSEVKVVRRWPKEPGAHPAAPAAIPPRPVELARLPRRRVELVAIGASTGGPVVLKDVLAPLPATFPVPIVVVQHMARGFMQGLADWLSSACAMRVEVATAGTRLQRGCIYLAPDGVHTRLGPDAMLVCAPGEPVNGHMPAVSCLFASVAAHAGRNAIGILLTGMGRDGAQELKQMKDAGAITVAQDRASSTIHGMPGEAIRAGAATYVMSPQEIAAALPALVAR